MNKYVKIGLAIINTLLSVALILFTLWSFWLIGGFQYSLLNLPALMAAIFITLFTLSIIASWKVALDKSGLVSSAWKILSFGWVVPILFFSSL